MAKVTDRYQVKIILEPRWVFKASSLTRDKWQISLLGLELQFDKNEGVCIFEAENMSQAEKRIKESISWLVDLLNVQVPVDIKWRIGDLRNIDKAEPRIGERYVRAQFEIAASDLANEPLEIQRCLKEDCARDADILQSIEYFNLGKYLMSTDLKGHYGIAYLQFYKSIETLLGTSKDISSLKRSGIPLGLSEQFIEQEIVPLYNGRDDWDVAHRRRGANRVNESDARKSQEIAKTVIIKYLLSKYGS